MLADLKTNYYRLDSFYLDIACLQFGNYELKQQTYVDVFFRNFFFLKTEQNWIEKLKALQETQQEVGQLVSDFFSMLMEVVCNEIAIPNVLAKICVFTKEMYGSEIIDGYRPYSEAVINFMR